MYNSADELEKGIVQEVPIYIRHAFIRKVYLLLTVQLLITGGISLLPIFWTSSFEWIKDPQVMLISAFITFPIICCIPLIKHKFPWNILLLIIFTGCMAISVAHTVALIHNPNLVLQALGMTTMIFSSLTVFTLQTRYDFSFMAVWLYICLITFVLFSIIQLFVASYWLHMVMSWTGVVLFSGYILYDTSLLIYQYGPDDAIEACLNLYLDILNLFLMLLNVLSGDRNE